MQETKRFKVNLGTFDLVKGLAMMFVVIGHMTSYYNLAKMPALIPAFRLIILTASGLMPLFFMISGYGFKEKPAGVMLKKTSRELLKPYLLVMLFIALLFPAIHFLSYRWWPGALGETVRYILAYLFGIAKPGKVLFGYSLYECTVVWFLLAMFWAMNILNLILRIKNTYIQAVLVAVCILAGRGLFIRDFTYYCLPQGLLAIGFCYVGYLFRKHKILERAKSTKALYGICLILFLITILQKRRDFFNLAYGQFEHFGIEYLGAVCSGILFLFLGAYSGSIEWRGLDWIKRIGIYTYWIMCIHSVEETCIPWYKWSNMMPDHQQIAFLMEICMKILVFSITCLVLKKISRNQYYGSKKKHGK